MIKIRKNQKEAFSDAAFRDFEDRMLLHLNKFFPAHCDALGEPVVREQIRYGIERASTYGIIIEREVCIYIDAMFAFGRDFDRDPKLPWVAAILNEASPTKADLLFHAAFEHLDEANGIDPETIHSGGVAT